jgi:multidrug efflux system outer membrane protein
MTLYRRLFTPVFALLLAGCSLHRPAVVAMPELPAQWRHETEAARAAEITRDWWRGFGSVELDVLVRAAQAQSLDVAAADARVRQAEASVRIAGAALLPEVTAGVNLGRQGSLDGNGGGSRYDAGLSARYEVDFWGRNRAGRDGALATLAASTFDRDTVRLTVTAGVAGVWLQAVALRERIGIAELNLRSAERLLALVESRERAGAAAPLELAQQRGLVANQQRNLAALRQQAEDSRTVLGVLLARTSGVEIGQTSLAPLRLPAIGAGLPSELLARRPDIARAEARLAAADANVTVARAAMLPSLTLSGNLAGGNNLGRVFDNPAYALVLGLTACAGSSGLSGCAYSLAAGLAAPIFNAGRLAAGRDRALAQREELLSDYRAAIVAALGDVEVALNAVAGLDAQAGAQAEELVQARRALALAESRYRAGAGTLLNLLDAQRTAYAAQDAAVQLKLARLLASVALYKALGGGWQAGPGAQRVAAAGERTP